MKIKEKKFYICKHCGNLVGLINNAGVPLVCCGEEMMELIPNTKDAAVEKHIPVINVVGNKVIVEIGSAPHPMTEGIISVGFILKQKGGQRKELLRGTNHMLVTEDDTLESAYAYCNLHGLWKSNV